MSKLSKAVNDDDKLLWYPMRVTYSRQMKMKESLDNRNIDNFIPMKYEIVDNKRNFIPAINNLIFIRQSYNELKRMKREEEHFHPLRFYMRQVTTEGANGPVTSRRPLSIREKEMEDFMRVSSNIVNERVQFIENMDFACKPGDKVLISEGDFAGVKGIVKRIRKNLSVVIAIKGVIAVAVTQVPKKSLIYLTEEEYLSDSPPR